MKPNIWKAVVGGFLGTVLLTLMERFVAPMMGVRMDIVGKLGEMTHTGMAGGLLMHFLNGTVIFPLIYAYLLFRFLPGAPWQKGLLCGVILWLGLEIVMMPMLGGGLFSAEMGGRKAVIAALIGHLVYGTILGAVAGAPPAVSQRSRSNL
jgi:uncharacterized membrane protein YagU involved in acid resistance